MEEGGGHLRGRRVEVGSRASWTISFDATECRAQVGDQGSVVLFACSMWHAQAEAETAVQGAMLLMFEGVSADCAGG